jgi:hypothetical protein
LQQRIRREAVDCYHHLRDQGRTLEQCGECSVFGNTRAGSDGGGIDNVGQATLNYCEVYGNSANLGGGIANDSNSAAMSISNSDVYSNTAATDGGGIWVQGQLTMTGGSLTNNRAVNGGGIYIDSTAPNSVTMTGVAIKNNNGTTAGGGFYLEAGSLTLNSITITGNMSPLGPGGVWRKLPASTLTINNPVLITDAIVQIN